MTEYSVQYTAKAVKQLSKLDKQTRKIIYAWIDKNLQGCTNPRAKGKSLTGNLGGQWRYRIGDYRLLCEIKDDELVILALRVGHRREIYE